MNLFAFFFGKKRAGMSEFPKPLRPKPKTALYEPVTPGRRIKTLTERYEELMRKNDQT